MDRVTEWQRDRWADGQRDRGTEGQRDRGTEGQRDRGTEGQRGRETETKTEREREEVKKRRAIISRLVWSYIRSTKRSRAASKEGKSSSKYSEAKHSRYVALVTYVTAETGGRKQNGAISHSLALPYSTSETPNDLYSFLLVVISQLVNARYWTGVVAVGKLLLTISSGFP